MFFPFPFLHKYAGLLEMALQLIPLDLLFRDLLQSLDATIR
jgi:hypothetical protein